MVCSCTSTDGHGDDRSLELNTLSVFYARSLRVQVLRENVGYLTVQVLREKERLSIRSGVTRKGEVIQPFRCHEKR